MTETEMRELAGGLTIRPAVAADTPLILQFIRDLSVYERMEDEVEADEGQLRRSLFGERPAAEVLIAEVDGRPAGFALFYHNFSTFVGRPGLYLEDLFVAPELRGRGIGRRLLARLAAIAVERGCGRFEWSVLDWNEPAIRFYVGLGARPMDGWTVYRVTGESLERLAREA